MEKLFVSPEVALQLKELGFNEPCLANYRGNDIFLIRIQPIIFEENFVIVPLSYASYTRKSDLWSVSVYREMPS